MCGGWKWERKWGRGRGREVLRAEGGGWGKMEEGERRMEERERKVEAVGRAKRARERVGRWPCWAGRGGARLTV